MAQWKNLASMMALSLAAAIAGTGCLAEDTSDESVNETEIAMAAQPEAQDAVADVQTEDGKTGEAGQAWWGGFGFPFWGGFGGLGFGGFGIPFWGGFGGCGLGFGGCGIPFWGGFGGCGLGFGGCGW